MQQIPVHQHDPKQVDGKIYVRLTEGHYQRIRRAISGTLMLMFFLTAWINLDGQQIVLFDFFSRRLHLFGMLLSPKDIYLLAGFMIVGAILLFALASAYSRVWCGFACPQSIWTWVFIRIETLTEGRRNNRIKDDQKGWNPSKLSRRIAKHSLWALFATLTSMTFIGYFVPIREIASDIISLNLSLEMFSWILIFALLTYVNAGLVREKVCAHMCPYARFQSVMFDPDTRNISYDVERGEPRHKNRSSSNEGGDCIDCKLCVHVCPTGIDIRQGLQSDCISCGACIDACDDVMTRIRRPTGLIRFISENQEQGKASPVLRPRIYAYIASIVLISGYLAWAFANKEALIMDVLRDRQTLYVTNGAGEICNEYHLIIENVSVAATDFSLALDNSLLRLEGKSSLNLQPGQRNELNYRVCAPHDTDTALIPRQINFTAASSDSQWQQLSSFIMPQQRR